MNETHNQKIFLTVKREECRRTTLYANTLSPPS